MSSRLFLRHALAVLFSAIAAHGQAVSPAHIRLSSLPIQQRQAPPGEQFNLGRPPVVALSPIDDKLRDQPSPRPGVTRVGVTRTIDQATLAQGAWQITSDGNPLWRLTIGSPNAIGLRLHFTGFQVGGGQVWVHDTHSPSVQTFGPYTGAGRFGDGDFWTEAVFADTVVIEYRPAPNSAGSSLPPFAISELTHLWQFGPYQAPRASANATNSGTVTAAAPPGNLMCFEDATCSQSNSVVYNASHAESMIQFGNYQCSATLLNAPNGAPLLLTAGHCVNTQTDARDTQAFFDVRTTQCNQDANTYPNLSSFPYANGQTLLAFSNEAFLDGTKSSEVQNDLDYSLIQLQAFPNASDVILSGYDPADDVAIGAPLTSLSFPLGLFMKVSFGTRASASTSDGSFFNNAYEIDMSQTGQGRVDEGSSGSGIFSADSYLVGLLSTIDSCPNPLKNGSCASTYTSCSALLPFDTWYTKFSAVYPNIQTYLNNPLMGQPVNNVSFTANPNPITVEDGSGLGQTTLFFNDPAASELQIRVGSPAGPELSDTGNSGQAATGKWITNGTTFYLQDVSNGKPLTSANTAATVTVAFASTSFTANPSGFAPGAIGQTTLSWSAPNSTVVEIHVGSPTGTLFAEGNSNGSAVTGTWATAGLPFYLIDASSRAVLSTLTLQSSASGPASLEASPNPIVVPSGGPALGQTTLTWTGGAARNTEVRVGSVNGPLFAAAGNTGIATTGVWVTNGLTFYLQNVSGGAPLTSANTLATTTVTVIQQ